MYELLTLGSVEVREDRGGQVRPVSVPPKPLAVLAYLAVERSARRDTLLGLFWPDLSERRARTALRKTLHRIRRSIDSGALVTDGETVRVDPEVLRCDAAVFDAALERGDREAALDVYGGPFLKGFHVSDAVEFEHWAERRRTDLEKRAREAVARLAEELADDDPAAAARWARRGLAIDPLDESALRRYVRLLDVAGDRSGAVRAYERLGARARAGRGARAGDPGADRGGARARRRLRGGVRGVGRGRGCRGGRRGGGPLRGESPVRGDPGPGSRGAAPTPPRRVRRGRLRGGRAGRGGRLVGSGGPLRGFAGGRGGELRRRGRRAPVPRRRRGADPVPRGDDGPVGRQPRRHRRAAADRPPGGRDGVGSVGRATGRGRRRSPPSRRHARRAVGGGRRRGGPRGTSAAERRDPRRRRGPAAGADRGRRPGRQPLCAGGSADRADAGRRGAAVGPPPPAGRRAAGHDPLAAGFEGVSHRRESLPPGAVGGGDPGVQGRGGRRLHVRAGVLQAGGRPRPDRAAPPGVGLRPAGGASRPSTAGPRGAAGEGPRGDGPRRGRVTGPLPGAPDPRSGVGVRLVRPRRGALLRRAPAAPPPVRLPRRAAPRHRDQPLLRPRLQPPRGGRVRAPGPTPSGSSTASPGSTTGARPAWGTGPPGIWRGERRGREPAGSPRWTR